MKALEKITAEAWEPADSPENEKQFVEFLELLRADIAAGIRGPRCASYRLGRRIIAAHLKPRK